MQSCKHKAPANIAPAEKENVSYTPRVADISRANGQVNDIDLKTFTSLIVENDLQKLSFNCPIPCIIDFYATWCGPCTKLHPILEKLGQSDDYDIIKIDIDESPAIADKYNISAVPTLIIYKNGKAISRSEGYFDYDTLKEKMDAQL